MARIEITPTSQDEGFARNETPISDEDREIAELKSKIAKREAEMKATAQLQQEEKANSKEPKREPEKEQAVLSAQDIFALVKFHLAKAMEYASALG